MSGVRERGKDKGESDLTSKILTGAAVGVGIGLGALVAYRVSQSLQSSVEAMAKGSSKAPSTPQQQSTNANQNQPKKPAVAPPPPPPAPKKKEPAPAAQAAQPKPAQGKPNAPKTPNPSQNKGGVGTQSQPKPVPAVPNPSQNQKKPGTGAQSQPKSSAPAPAVKKTSPAPSAKKEKSPPAPPTPTPGSGGKKSPPTGSVPILRQISNTSSLSSTSSRSSSGRVCSNDLRLQIVIAIDATTGAAGGLLFLPEIKKELPQVHFYYIRWNRIFEFDQPEFERPEVVNAALAMEIFGTEIRRHRRATESYGKIVVKSCTKFSANGSSRSLLQKTRDKLTSMQGEWENCGSADCHVKVAQKLCRGQLKESDSISSLLKDSGGGDVNYKEVNVSKTHYSALHSMAIVIPLQLK